MRRQASRHASPTVGLTPLIDVVFILLIFFMVATSFDMPRLLSLTPATGGSGKQSERPVVQLYVGANGVCKFKNESRPCDMVSQLIMADTKDGIFPVVKLTPESSTVLQDIVMVMDLLAAQGLTDTVLVPNNKKTGN